MAILLVAEATANAGCAGISSGAISTKYSEALRACPTTADVDAMPTTPQASDLPQTATIAYSMPTPISRRRSVVRARAGRPTTIAIVSRHYRIDPMLLDAIVARESGYRTGAVSAKGALGLMQLMPATARGLGVADPARLLTDPTLNLVAGATYLKQLQGQFGNNVPAVLAAYNAGPGAVRRFGGIPRYRETQTYVTTIMSRYNAARSGAR